MVNGIEFVAGVVYVHRLNERLARADRERVANSLPTPAKG